MDLECKAEYWLAAVPTYSNYTNFSSATFPRRESAKPLIVVSNLTQSDTQSEVRFRSATISTRAPATICKGEGF